VRVASRSSDRPKAHHYDEDDDHHHDDDEKAVVSRSIGAWAWACVVWRGVGAGGRRGNCTRATSLRDRDRTFDRRGPRSPRPWDAPPNPPSYSTRPPPSQPQCVDVATLDGIRPIHPASGLPAWFQDRGLRFCVDHISCVCCAFRENRIHEIEWRFPQKRSE